jgi:limonene-1,2-epoxide hydrolase
VTEEERVVREFYEAFNAGDLERSAAQFAVIASGDTVIVEWDSRGTWTGASIRGKQPNARRFERRGCAVAEVEQGKIVRCRDYFDRANMWQPLGLMHSFDG